MKLITRHKVVVPGNGVQEIAAPTLSKYELSHIVAKTPDGQEHTIKRSTRNGSRDFIILKLIGQKPRSIVPVDFCYRENVDKVKVDVPPTPEPEKIPVSNTAVDAKSVPPVSIKPKLRRPFLGKLQNKKIERDEVNKAAIDAIRQTDLSYAKLSGQKILTFDAVYSWPRWLGMLQKAWQLENQLKKPLWQCFDRITGQGDGAILAAAVAAGLSFERLSNWGITEWRQVHTPNFPGKATRWLASKVQPWQSGYDAKRARTALQSLFSKSSTELRMKDSLTEVQINVMQGDMKVSSHYSPKNQEMELWTAVEDTAITKMHYNQRETVQGEAVFLSSVEKNDNLGLILSKNNKNLRIVSIGAPVRVNPKTAKKLSKLGHAADKTTQQAAGHFTYEKRVRQLIEKLAEVGYNIHYMRLECSSIDEVVGNDTGSEAMQVGIDSGKGKIELLKGGSYAAIS